MTEAGALAQVAPRSDADAGREYYKVLGQILNHDPNLAAAKPRNLLQRMAIAVDVCLEMLMQRPAVATE